ncbi:MAG: 4Fe-4S dicluster domain-containing protein [Fibromonadaceae bacterium]|nr:4Fe-4S dicluster domain-containing protein [Fibromonadaceae bacterium]
MIQIICFVCMTLLFLDFTGTLHAYLGWVAKIQLVPAIFAANFIIVLVIVFLTLLFGRFYCSMLCPLGIFQDIVSFKTRFSYSKPRKGFVILRYSLFAGFVATAFAGGGLVSLLEPYAAYGRIVSQIFGPIYKCGNNLLAYFAERAGSYAFYSVDIWVKSSVSLVLAILTFVGVSIYAYKSGRGYCNTVCPVGTFLGFLSKYSFMKYRIDLAKCKHCDLCVKSCRASCIDTIEGKIDYTRCITCEKCKKVCPSKAISYSKPPKRIEQKKAETLSEGGNERRNLFVGSTIAILSSAAKLQASNGDGGLTVLVDKKVPANRQSPIVPAGSGSFKHFHDHCLGCQLCASVCPNDVLSNKAFGTTKPNMSFERGYCRPECVKCSEVCPTGAIKPITRAEKSSIQIGYAVWNKELCIVNKDKVVCDLCSRKCPNAAISMIPQSADAPPDAPKIPMIDTSRCIGCGACEHLCPSRPYSAIYVEGVEVHRVV